MSDPGGQPGREPTQEEMQAALEAELDRIPVAALVLESAVSLLNLGARRVGLTGGPQGHDLGQARTAIEAVRALLATIEDQVEPQQLATIKDALSQLQLAYAKAGGEAGASEPSAAGEDQSRQPEEPSGPGPAQSSGRLWVPGQ